MRKFLGLVCLFGAVFLCNYASAETYSSLSYDYGVLVPTQSSIKFADGTSSDYDFWLPVGGEKKYYKYTYTKPSGYTNGTQATSLSTSIDNKYYEDMHKVNSMQTGGALTTGTASIDHIIADFVGNTTTFTYTSSMNGTTGGAIMIKDQISNIEGAFMENLGATGGGAIELAGDSSGVYVGTITGDFIKNIAGNNLF